MKLTDALEDVFDGHQRITRRKWANRAIYLSLDTRQRLCTTWDGATGGIDGLLHPWIITDEDWFADDWEVVE